MTTAQPSTATPPSETPLRWYCADANNHPRGPLSRDEIACLKLGGMISDQTLVMKEGGGDWQPYGKVFGAATYGTPTSPSMPEREQTILEIAKRARIRSVCGAYAPVVNCTAFEEEVCLQILKLFPEAAFTACWHVRGDGSELWTLFSAGKCDVGQIARQMRGNGDARRVEFIEPAVDVEKIIHERDELIHELAMLEPAIP